MNSFDVFDTLLARRFVSAVPLFNQIEIETKIQDFAARRRAADNGTRGLAEIYQALDVSPAVMERELQLEFENAIPIQQNLLRVQHGDLLISDMYMPASDILRMVRGVGLNKQVTIFQSNKGKSSGEVWRRLIHNQPECHLGDNAHSDFQLPGSLGFRCELYDGAKLTRSEAVLVDAGLPLLACLIREIRLGALSDEHPEFFRIACQLNLPWLFVTAEMIRRQHAEKLTFLGRDCQLLAKIFNAYFSPCYYLPFSRRVAYAQPDIAVTYLKAHTPPGGLLIDIASSGATWEKLNSDFRIAVVIYSDAHCYTGIRPRPPAGFTFLTRQSEHPHINQVMEIFNCGDHGYLDRIEPLADGLMRTEFAPLQLDTEMIKVIHAPVKAAEALARVYRDKLLVELGRITAPNLLALFGAFSQEVCAQCRLPKHLTHYFHSEVDYIALLQSAGNSQWRTAADQLAQPA